MSHRVPYSYGLTIFVTKKKELPANTVPSSTHTSPTPDPMSKVTGGGGGKSKGGKSTSKGKGSEVASTRQEKLSTSRNGDVVTLLRGALRNDDGSDKDLLAELPSFKAFKRNGLQLSIEFRTGKQLDKAEATACFRMTKVHMEEEYDLSGYGWVCHALLS